MKRNNTIVTPDNGPRPAGKSYLCFYCHSPVGFTHRPSCVVLQRSVVVRHVLDVVVSVPDDWDVSTIEFQRGESSWCASNFMGELQNIIDSGQCLCGPLQQATYLREATEDDHERQGFTWDAGERRWWCELLTTFWTAVAWIAIGQERWQ